MNSDPHLLTEDRPQFERILDQALRTMPAAPPTSAPGPGAPPTGPNTEQLRTLALAAAPAIAASAAAEYEALLRARGADRAARSGAVPVPGVPLPGVAGAVSGAGLFPMAAVLVPVLAGTAAALFLLAGYLLGALSPAPEVAGPLRVAGWTFLALAAAGVLTGTVGMLLTALRDGSSAIHATGAGDHDAVGAARETWSAALLERGILPFLDESRGSWPAVRSGAAAAARSGRPAPDRRAGRFGYSRPGFSSPDFSGPEDGDHASGGLTGHDFGPDAPYGGAGEPGDRQL